MTAVEEGTKEIVCFGCVRDILRKRPLGYEVDEQNLATQSRAKLEPSEQKFDIFSFGLGATDAGR